jgi:hypothetical protein
LAYLLSIAFDNSRRFRRKSYVFEYQGTRFKLVQDDPRRWSDHLLTIARDNSYATRQHVFTVAAEFLNALAWETNARMTVHETGSITWPDEYPIRRTKPFIRTFPEIPYGGAILGYDLERVPHVSTPEQRGALAIYREANASNNSYLAFLFFWQVLEIGGGKASCFVEEALAGQHGRLRFNVQELLGRLPLIQGQSTGEYLFDNCRSAIAHLKRYPWKRALNLDELQDRARIAASAELVGEIARHYIRTVLGLSESLTLSRPRNGGLPVFASRTELQSGQFRPVEYPPFSQGLSRPRPPRR